MSAAATLSAVAENGDDAHAASGHEEVARGIKEGWI
jgi:hypothetical protein